MISGRRRVAAQVGRLPRVHFAATGYDVTVFVVVVGQAWPEVAGEGDVIA